MLKPKWRSKWIKRQVEMWGLELGKKVYCSPMPLTRDRRPISRDSCLGENGLAIKRPCRRTAHIQWTLRNGPAGKLQTCTAAKTEPFPRYFPGKGHGAGEVTASESWKVRSRPRGYAPKPRGAGATTGRRRPGQRRASSPAPPRTAWPPPSRPALRLRPHPPSHQSHGDLRPPVP